MGTSSVPQYYTYALTSMRTSAYIVISKFKMTDDFSKMAKLLFITVKMSKSKKQKFEQTFAEDCKELVGASDSESSESKDKLEYLKGNPCEKVKNCKCFLCSECHVVDRDRLRWVMRKKDNKINDLEEEVENLKEEVENLKEEIKKLKSTE